MGACDYEAVSALVDGELSDQECETVIQHLNECRACCHLFERFHATRSLVRGEGEAAVPVDLSDRIASAIPEEEAPSGGADVVSGPWGAGKHKPPRRTWLATAAGVAGVAVAAGALWLQTDTRPGTASAPAMADADSPSRTETAARPAAEQDNNVAAIRRYLPEHSSFVPSGPDAEFQRTTLEVKDR